MSAWYNENDPFAADWLEALIKEGLIADGVVDRRSIADVRPADLRGFDQCHFFAGIGGWSLALRAAGWPDNRAVWTGSCPCQPFSLAGAQGGFSDPRHLWPDWAWHIGQRRPAIVFGEQVASATDWLRLVRGDLEEMGYAVGAVPVQAASAGADHLRDRYWFVAYTDDAGSQGRRVLPERAGEWPSRSHGVANADSLRGQVDQVAGGRADGGSAGPLTGPCCARDGDMGLPDGSRSSEGGEATSIPRHGDSAVATDWGDSLEWIIGADGKARRVKSGVRLLAHGVPNRVGLLRGFGNAIDHRPAKEFIGAYLDANPI